MEIALAAVLLIGAGLALRSIAAPMKVPNVITYMVLGVVVGPSALGWLPDAYLDVGTTLTKAAFVVVLLRAGMSIPPATLRGLAPFALLFGIIPVVAEGLVVTVLVKGTLFDSWRIAALAGALVAAISPAVVIPTMQNQKDRLIGTKRALPDRIMAMTLVNLIVAQSAILTLIEITRYWEPSRAAFAHVYWFPISVLGGIAVGAAVGSVLPLGTALGRDARISPRPQACAAGIAMVLAAGLAVYFGATVLALESVFATFAVAIFLRRRADWWEPVLRPYWHRTWSLAEVLLFGTLGAQIDIGQLVQGRAVLGLCGVVVVGLAVRVGVTALLSRTTDLRGAYLAHVLFAQVPKATVQAVFGAVPLAIFVAAGREPLYADGSMLLILSVVAIVLTAPLGALLLERNGDHIERSEIANSSR